MDYGRAFTFFTEDEEWIPKILVGGLLLVFGFLLVPLIPFVGYLLELQQNVMRGAARPLPRWDNIGDKFMKGVAVAAIAFVYALPAILLACCFTGVVSVLSGSNSSGGNNASAGLVSVITFCLSCLIVLYALVIAVLLPAALTLFAASGRLGDAFNLRAVIPYVRDNAGNYFIAIALALVAGVISQFGAIACFIGLFFTSVWSQWVQFYLLGEVYRQARGIAPPDALAPSGSSF